MLRTLCLLPLLLTLWHCEPGRRELGQELPPDDLVPPAAAPGAWNIDQAYLGAWSVVQGGSIEVYVSTAEPFFLDLRRIGLAATLHWEGGPYVSGIQPLPAEPWKTSLDWSNPVSVPISADLPSGYYQLAVTFIDGTRLPLHFVVREDQPGSTAPLLVLDNATTRAAYNAWGGKSLYKSTVGGMSADIVNLHRPDQFEAVTQQKNFLRWAERAGIPLEWASSVDWHNDPQLFAPYETIVLVEHSEYWSREMREQLDLHLDSGGHLLSLAGNTAWWQVRFDGDQMIGYKHAQSDPLYGVDDDRVTTHFHASPVNWPENSTIGVSYRNGGYHNAFGFYPAAEGFGGYTVVDPEHLLFDGTGLEEGDQFGTAHSIVGYEVDGAEFAMVDGHPVVTGADGTLLTLEVLATAPAATPEWTGNATMVAGRVSWAGGQLINMATTDWANGLWDRVGKEIADPVVGKITLNAINYLSPGAGAACEAGCHAVTYNDADQDGIDDKCDPCILVPDATGDGDEGDDDGDGEDEPFCQSDDD